MEEQIARIKNKLKLAKEVDKKLQVFGASKHHYQLGDPVDEVTVSAFETTYNIQLPAAYRSFVSQIGNAGNSVNKSGAGPFYGIYPLGDGIDDLVFENTAYYLQQPSVLYPDMTDEWWASQTTQLDAGDLSDEEYEKRRSSLFAGILPIGSQGCTYLHGLVVNGPYQGRIVNLDMDLQKPSFCFEDNFLHWYERWLDEVISKELINDEASWFGYTIGGTEEYLLEQYQETKDPVWKGHYLSGLANKTKLQPATLTAITVLLNNHPGSDRVRLTGLLCKSDYALAKPYLQQLAPEHLLSLFQFIYWYAKKYSKEWVPVMETHLSDMEDAETFRFGTYLLREADIAYGQLIAPFTQHQNEAIRITAFYTLGLLKNKKQFLDYFVNGLNNSSNRTIHAALQALAGLKDDRLLIHYKTIAQKFPEETDYILSNLNHRLKEYGFTNKTILKHNI